jgi:crotonobetainyl-CoA:carnitine CoA-transferase CaiB-like acyl-CoA transferase
LCRVLRRDDLVGDARFATREARAANGAELTAVLAGVFLTDHAINWRRALDAAGVPSEISVDTSDGETILFDDDLVRLGLVTEYEHPVLGRVRQFGNLMTFSDTPTRPERPTPMLGQQTREILDELGYDEDAMDDYRARGVVSWPDDAYPYPV